MAVPLAPCLLLALGVCNMLTAGHQFRIAGALGALLLIASSISCGWFVSPGLSRLTITPSSSSLTAVDNTEQLIATLTYNDGSTRDITASGTTWSVSNPNVASVSKGLVKALAVAGWPYLVTITATNVSSAGAISNTATACIGPSCTSTASTITVTCTSCSSGTAVSLASGTTLTFTAANENGADVTTEATWSTNPSAILSIPSTTSTSPVMGTLEGMTGFVAVTATVNGTSGALALKVTQ